MTALLQIESLSVSYPLDRHRHLLAVEKVSVELPSGTTLAIVGESGCGKSTLARAVCGLTPISSGTVRLQGERIGSPHQPVDTRRIGHLVQYIFQDPFDALDPRLTVRKILEEPLRYLARQLTAKERENRILQALSEVALAAEHLERFPHEFSGGQAQRIGIARALVTEPRLLLCDEPVSALDVSIQAQIINLLLDLQRNRQLGLFMISHDLRVVRHLADRILVLYLGQVMEIAPTSALFGAAHHPYTHALLTAIPKSDPAAERERLRCTQAHLQPPPSPIARPTGCVFYSRCPHADQRCRTERPQRTRINEQHVVYCHHPVTNPNLSTLKSE